ncbi:cyclic nucleotide-binding domain containing protein [Trichomonas vaginalis G3]|uniref:Cyclic nucleotide-binding domain containing protein n=1 Tax=Trichomonas vaginalis (strain ATCC PRA-98 / G3) TaxID=412133 RepID=A2EKL9_TRIV3|nr:cAMP-dependent protein kinase regulator protein [Trichomonas vaginalis G3]EAY06758.1 cyclic nucleotide-binding domain containing protein [Trichomonas vaginalis G3]KAI5485891.1 cAMP-dependent protein kinase regulator protein [Trichomonas vaginalis G3]|eukprot:XP_001318981.1 cyclic nucleotide-binding domain containing protein [Trichomonas vaginalis G3]
MTQSPNELSGEEYLKQHNVEGILQEIVVSLLQNRPTDVRKYISEMWQQAPIPFPSKMNNGSGQAYSSINSQKVQNAVPTRRISAVSPAAILKNRDERRKAFSSKSISATTMEIPKHPKTPEEYTQIETICKKVSFLSYLKSDQLDALINAFFKMEFKDKDVIIKQGDKPDNFYIIQSGNVDIWKKTGDAPEVKVITLSEGSYFGELALMSGRTRAATVIAAGTVYCWAIDQTTYLYLLKDIHYQRRQKCKEIISEVPIFNQLPDYQAILVAEAAVLEEYQPATTIIKQGEIGNKFYVILAGTVDVIIDGKKVNELGPGKYFGERALIYNCARAATIITTSQVRIAYISGEVFRKILDKCHATFKNNELTYKKAE